MSQSRQALTQELLGLSASNLARLWAKITGLIPDVTLTPETRALVAKYETLNENQKRFFARCSEQLLARTRRSELQNNGSEGNGPI